MLKLKLAILATGAALTLGSASALAMVAGDPDAHGDAVASAAHNCAHGPHGLHGHCVSSVARANGAAESAENSEKSPDKSEKGEHHGRALGRLS